MLIPGWHSWWMKWLSDSNRKWFGEVYQKWLWVIWFCWTMSRWFCPCSNSPLGCWWPGYQRATAKSIGRGTNLAQLSEKIGGGGRGSTRDPALWILATMAMISPSVEFEYRSFSGTKRRTMVLKEGNMEGDEARYLASYNHSRAPQVVLQKTWEVERGKITCFQMLWK